jgi:proteasome accessory factor C
MSGRRGPKPTSERVKRLLVMLPWLMEQGVVPLRDVAARFGLTEAEAVRDIELAAMCGLPPYQDELVDVFIDDDMVVTGIPRLFTRPLRLTAPEGFAILAAAGAALELPGADLGGPLARALDKLSKVLGPSPVVVDAPAPPFADDLVAAATAGARVRMQYTKAFSDETEERYITPRRVFFDRGNWYVLADDHERGEERHFRIDRVASMALTGETDTLREVQAPAGDDWFADAGLPTVTLDLAPGGAWVVERYPVVSSEATEGRHRVVLSVAHEAWLAELLLRLGPDATVVAPLEWASLGRDAAATLRSVYKPGT